MSKCLRSPRPSASQGRRRLRSERAARRSLTGPSPPVRLSGSPAVHRADESPASPWRGRGLTGRNALPRDGLQHLQFGVVVRWPDVLSPMGRAHDCTAVGLDVVFTVSR